MKKSLFALAIALAFGTVASVQAQPAPAAATAPATIDDAQIAHIAYTAGAIDVTAAKQALKKSHNKAVIAFAEEMARDHAAVNEQALALCKKLGVTPADNPTSQALAKAAAAEQVKLAALSDAGLVSSERAGRETRYQLTVAGAEWDERLDALRRHLERRA
mgnify:CR=1 FL=1